MTLSPALCPLLLKPGHGERKNIFFRGFDQVFGRLSSGYAAGVRATIHGALVTLVIFGVLCLAAWRMSTIVPSGFLPDEDQGTVYAAVLLPEASSLDKTQRVIGQAVDYFRNHPAVADVVSLGGFDFLAGGSASTNSGMMFVSLKPFAEREEPGLSAMDVMAAGQQFAATVTDGLVLTLNPPAIQGLGNRSGFTAELQQRGGGTVAELAEVGNRFVAAAQESGEVTGLNATLRVSLPQVFIDLNREKTQMMGIQLARVFEPLQVYFGSLYVNDFNRFGRIWRVQMQAEPEFRNNPQDIERIYVRNDFGGMVPLSAIIDRQFRTGPNVVTRFNGFPAIEITGVPTAERSSGDAVNTLQELAAEHLPPGYGIDWSGETYQEIKAGNQAPLVMAFGLLMVYLVLAAQYERWLLPVGVLLAVPLAMLGALIGIWFRDYSQDIYFQIGVLMLIGLSAKNAILIVEFCMTLRQEGKGIVESAIEAAKLRFRPIMMTALTVILGVLPLVVATGAGAAGRRSLGTTVASGMFAATFLAIFFVPLFYVLIQRTSEYFARPNPDPASDQAE